MVRTGTLSHLEIEDSEFKQMDFAIMNLGNLRNNQSIKLDGILGTPFLQNCKMSINYRQRKLYLWQPEKPTLAVKKSNRIK